MTDFIRMFDDPRLTGYVHPALTGWGARRRIRRQLLNLLEPPDAPAPELVQEVVDVLIDALSEASPQLRVHGTWVMSSGWKQKIVDTAKWDKPQVTLYGLPVVVRDDADVPHLEVIG